MYSTITQIRTAFWEAHPQFIREYRARKRQNDYRADIRCTFCEWLDCIHKDGLISDHLANIVTL